MAFHDCSLTVKNCWKNYVVQFHLWKQKRGCFQTFMIKSVFLKLLEMPWIHSCVGSRLLEKPFLRKSFLASLLVWYCVFMYGLFLMYLRNSDGSFFKQLCLAALMRECLTNKYVERVLLRDEAFMWKILSWVSGDPAIPPRWNGMENIPASCKHTIIFLKETTVVFWSCLLFCPRCHIKRS